MSKFVHLHVHTEYSLLDGAARIKKLVSTCKQYNMPAVAITDHGNMFGSIVFYNECKSQGIKPIIGCEFYIVNDLMQKAGNKENAHLVLLAKNETGYRNICKLNSIAWVDGFYYKPRIDYKTLEQYSEGIVCLSACLAGDIPQYILNRQYDKAEELTLWFKRVFGDDFYLELQDHGLEEQVELNKKLVELSKKLGVKLVATNDVHYINKEDAEVQDVLMCVQMGKTIDDPNRLKFPCDEFYVKTYEQMAELFPNNLDALENTLEIADKCNFDFVFGKYMFPRYIPENGMEPTEFLRKLTYDGIVKKYPALTDEIKERAESELALIEKLGFVEYFLIVWDYIDYAKSVDIPVGPGRGSGVGSLVAYAIGITNVDPLKFGLLFERFLHSERVSVPDFDIDFEDERRTEVIDYVRRKYGDERVCKIITFGRMAAKAAIKDVVRVLGMRYSDGDRITKLMPNNLKKPNIIKKAFGLHKPKEGDKDYGTVYGVPELVEMYNTDPQIKRAIDIAIKLEDCPRQASTHACGVVIGGDVLDKHLPLARNGEDIVTQYDMNEIEKLGHLKMDFLGLRNLTDIQKAKKYIKENHGVEIDFDKMEYDDPEVYKLISSGNTKAVFQLESGGFQKFLKELKPNCIEDIIAGVALYRPGPMDSIGRYVHVKHNPEDIVFDHPMLESILDVTYGCIVYQEQVMKIVQDMAGYTLGQADNVRRMMGKKKPEEMRKEREVFLYGKPAEGGKPAIDGAIKRGVDEKVAIKVWSEMETFASYAFNKSHAAAYAYLAYQTAYLKRYYEAEYLTAVLNNRITNAEEIKLYTNHAREEGIEVLPPDINQSMVYFSVKDNKIRFGLAALKGVGETVSENIIKEREKNGEYKDLVDFFSRCIQFGINKRLIEGMIASGGFDCFGVYRSQLFAVYENVLAMVVHDKKVKSSGQISMFEEAPIKVDYPKIKEFDEFYKLKKEKEVLGIYISGHPMNAYADRMKNFTFNASMLIELSLEDTGAGQEDETNFEKERLFENLKDAKIVTGGIIVEAKRVFTKATNKPMAILTVEDLYGSFEVMVFNKLYETIKTDLVADKIIAITGTISIKEGESVLVIANNIEFWSKSDDSEPDLTKVQSIYVDDNAVNNKLYLKYDLENKECHQEICEILDNYEGRVPVLVQSGKKLYNLNRGIDPTNALLLELKTAIGGNCVKLK